MNYNSRTRSLFDGAHEFLYLLSLVVIVCHQRLLEGRGSVHQKPAFREVSPQGHVNCKKEEHKKRIKPKRR